MEKKSIITIAVALIVVIAIVAGAAAALLHKGEDKYALRIEEGYRLLELGKYDEAIIEFKAAINLDNSQEDAYLGLYTTYVRMGDNAAARKVIYDAYGVAGGDNIRLLKERLDAMNQQGDTIIDVTNKDEGGDKSKTAVLNEEMLNLFCSANYSDYVSNYGTPVCTMKNGACNVRVNNLPATLVFKDTSSERVIDPAKGVPYGVFMPCQIHLDNATVLFGGRSVAYDTLRSMDELENLSKNGTEITFTYDNCDITITCTSAGMITADSESTIVITGRTQTVDKHTLSATIVDGTTGQPVSDVTVKAYAGYNTYGTPVVGKTNLSGVVTLELTESGNYTLEFSKNGYITETAEIYVYQTMGQVRGNFSIVPEMRDDTIRFVLTWGASPTDLDSYLIGTSGDGTYTSVYFRNMQATDSSGQLIAELDVDDTSSYGPETITLHDTRGTYKFVVHDYTRSGTMSYSSAQVKIYVGSSLYTTVSVPEGLNNEWYVCDVINGQITVVNEPT